MIKHIQKFFRAATILAIGLFAATACGKEDKTVNVTGVRLDNSSVTLQLNNGTNTTKLTATVEPDDAENKNVSWKSASPDIATVNEGVVTAVSVGTTTITVTTQDGGYSASCEVTVEKGTIFVTGITLDQSTISLTPGESARLTATVVPSDATDGSVIWSSSDDNVATVDETGKVTAIGKGEATITATTADQGLSATCKVVVTVPVTGITCDQKDVTLLDGATVKLNFTVLPEDASNKNIKIVSSDPSVATVENDGTVKGIKTGTAVITATTEDGEYSVSVNVRVFFSSNLVIYDTANESILAGKEIIIGLKSVLNLTVIDVTDPSFKATADMIKVSEGNDAVSITTGDQDGTGFVTITAVSAGSANLTISFESPRGKFEKTIKITVTDYAGGVPDIPVNPA